MATYTWLLQGVSPTTIEATDLVQFAGAGGFGTAILVNSWNDTTHVESSVGADDSSGNDPHNSKFISQAGGTGGDSQVSINGGATQDLDAVADANCPLKITFADPSSIAITDHIFYAYDGSTPATGPTGVNFKAAEQGDANWTDAEGSGAALALADSLTPATSHDFFLLISASPSSIGEKTDFVLRDELTYM